MNYHLCISIPIRYSNIEDLKPIIDKAKRSKPNIIELRFDYVSDLSIISEEFLKNLMNIIHPQSAVIFTYRNSSEGGQNLIKPEERLKIYKLFINIKPNYVDIEIKTENKILDEIINFAYQNGVNLIYSYHNFERTLSFEETINCINNFNKKLTQVLALDPKKLEGNIYKIIFTAQSFEDNLIPLKLCKEISSANKRIISFCMGSLGIFSRINCVFAGSYLTYTSLEEHTAQGQIHIEKMKEIYDLILDQS